MKPVHILHVFATFAPGGPQMRFIELSRRLGPGFRHTVVAADGISAAAALISPEVECELLDLGPRPSPLRFAGLVRRLRPGLLQTYNWGAFDALLGAVWANLCPVLHTEDGFGPDEAVRLKRHRVWARRLVLRRARALVVPSFRLADIARSQYWLPAERVRLIPNGVDTERFHPGSEPSLRSLWGFAAQDFVVGAVGGLRAEKNLGLLLRAFAAAQLPEARLLIVGEGPEREVLEALADRLQIRSRVIFAGHRDPAPCYRAMDLFAMSSLTEQMPLALLEAMASGLPALCTDVGDTSAVLNSPDLPVIVPSGDLDNYARALRLWAGCPELRRRAGERNRQRCLEEYSIGRMAARWESLYREIIQN